MIVMDNGIGLPRSIKARRGDLNAQEAVVQAFEGRLRYGARGRGLGRVAEVVARHPSSSFLMLTEFLRDRSRSLMVVVSDRQISVTEIAAPITGTLAIGQIALPAIARDEPSMFDESSDGVLEPIPV